MISGGVAFLGFGTRSTRPLTPQVPVMNHVHAVWAPRPRLELAFVRALVYACIQIGSVELVDELSADLWKGCEQIRKVRGV